MDFFSTVAQCRISSGGHSTLETCRDWTGPQSHIVLEHYLKIKSESNNDCAVLRTYCTTALQNLISYTLEQFPGDSELSAITKRLPNILSRLESIDMNIAIQLDGKSSPCLFAILRKHCFLFIFPRRTSVQTNDRSALSLLRASLIQSLLYLENNLDDLPDTTSRPTAPCPLYLPKFIAR